MTPTTIISKLNTTLTIALVLPLTLVLSNCQHGAKSGENGGTNGSVQADKQAKLSLYTLKNPPIWGQTIHKDEILAGGFSGLIYLGKNKKNNEYQFMTLTDRGANGEVLKINQIEKRPFLIPDFQVRFVKLETNSADHSLKIIDEIKLTDPKNKPILGLPQFSEGEHDEIAIDAFGKELKNSDMGVDAESLAVDKDGNYWVGEEYRPSLLKFNKNGKLISRYIPKNGLPKNIVNKINKKYGKNVLQEKLPEVYKYRKSNRGFEGLTYFNGKIYAMLQSPIPLADSKNKKIIRILEFDPIREVVTKEFFYPLIVDGVDKIGDLAVWNNQLIAIIQNSKTGAKSYHMITNWQLDDKNELSEPIEKMDFAEIQNKKLTVVPHDLINLVSIGYDFAEKIEGLATISENEIAVINDNDFQISGELNAKEGSVGFDRKRESVLGIIHF